MSQPVTLPTEPKRQREAERLLPAGAENPALSRLTGGSGEPENPSVSLPDGLILGERPALDGETFGLVDQQLAVFCAKLSAALRQKMPYAVGEQTGSAILRAAACLPALGALPGRALLRAAQLPPQHRAAFRDTLLQQQTESAHRGVGEKTAQDAPLAERVCRRENAHAHMMRHPAAHDLPLVPAASTGREIHGLVKAEAPPDAEALQAAQVPDRRRGVYREGKKARVRGDHQILVLPALERERGAAAGLVAVIERRVESEKGALADAPGFARVNLAPLRVETEARALMQQASLCVRQKQRRHQIFKHRTRPAGKTAKAVLLELGAAQAPPVLFRRLAARDCEITCEHGLACHQIVPAADAAFFRRVIGDIEQPTLLVEEEAKIHCAAERFHLVGKLLFTVGQQRLTQREKRGAEVAAVHGGEHGGRERRKAARVIPVIIMTGIARQLQQGGDDAPDAAHGVFLLQNAEIDGRREGQQTKPDVGRGGAMGNADGRLLLYVVRREKMILRRTKVQIVAEILCRGLKQVRPVGGSERALLLCRQAQRPGAERREQPHKPRRVPDDKRREEQKRKAQQRRLPQGEDVRGEIAGALFSLRGGLPLQQALVAHAHAPECGHRRRKADPGLIRQQPQPQKALYDRAAKPREQPCVVPRAGLFRRTQPVLGERPKDTPRESKQRRERRDLEPLPGQQEARQHSQQRHRREHASPQAVKEAPAINWAERGKKEEGEILPVAPHPAVQTLVVGEHPTGKGVGKRNVAHKAAAQQRALRRVMREDAPLGQLLFAAKQQGANVDQPLARKAAVPEGVHIQLAAQTAVGVRAPLPRENEREIRGVGAGEIGVQPGMQDAIAPRDNAALGIQNRTVEGVEHGADQFSRRAGVQTGIAVERE